MRRLKELNPITLFTVAALSLTVAAIALLGCGWSGTSHSVRFNGYQSEREMGRLPPLPTMANGLNEGRVSWILEGSEDEGYWERIAKKEKEVEALWDRAEAAEKDGNLHLGRQLLEEYLKTTDTARVLWFTPKDGQARHNAATDRLDALNALDHGSSAFAVKAYLDARRLHDRDKPDAAEIERAFASAESDRNLKDNVAYLRAAEQYRQKNFTEAAIAFKALAEKYPRSEKSEVARFMTAVATMKTSATYIPESGNSDYDEADSQVSTDQAWHDAFAAFEKLINEHPRGKYSNDARGWQAYLLLRRRDRAGALAQYYRLLADRHDEKARTEAAFSLTLVRSSATGDEMTRVEQDLADEPQAALTYAYHNIYNYSIDPGPSGPPYEEVKDYSGNYDYEATRARNDGLEKEWRKDLADAGSKELTRTLEFSKRLMARYPNLAVGGAFALRAAQASEELEDNEAAVTFAQRALKSGLPADQRREALWTLGVAQHRLRRLDDARQSFQLLLSDDPNTNLTEGARRLLAMIAEDAGDINGALEQYIALDYTVDEAYFVDYLMTPEQLAGFIEKQPDSPKKNELVYALGLRYLRQNRWEKARQTFARVQTSATSGWDAYCSSCNCDHGQGTNCVDPKDPVFDERENVVITPSLLMRDVQTANVLEGLERASDQAIGDEAKAEALYQYASYQYEASSLLFYNPLATPGYWNLGELAAQGSYRAPNEPQLLFDAHQEHDRLARALKIYLDIAQRFPQTRAARDALYTAAVSHERLSNYNPYWRQIYQNGLHAGTRMVTYADVKATYPNYQLPRGTYGWQPSTRTVNGGPGWEPPPPPPPKPRRLTRTERVKFYVGVARDNLNTFWEEKGKRWLTEIAIVLGLVFAVRIARRNHRRLRARMARQRIQQAKQIVTYPWFDWFWIEPVVPSRREQIRKLLNDKRQEFIDLARDRRGRPVLLRSMVSHTAVAGLIVSLLWTVWFG